MPVPTTIDQLSTTASVNSPSGSDSPSILDDHQRALASFIAKVRDLVGLGTGTYVPATAITNMALTASNLGITPAAIGAATSGANSNITSLSGLTTPLSVAQGGTGSATQPFVDLTTAQTVAGVKTLSNTPVLSAGATFGTATMSNPSGSAPIFGARAWCVFDGTLTGTNAPTAGGNVASITRNAAGDYTITFSTAMPDANYAIVVGYGGGNINGAYGFSRSQQVVAPAAGSARIGLISSGGSGQDSPYVSVVVIH